METHLPDTFADLNSPEIIKDERCSIETLSSNRTVNSETDLADVIFANTRVKQHYKSAGVGGIFPALIQNGKAVLIPSLPS